MRQVWMAAAMAVLLGASVAAAEPMAMNWGVKAETYTLRTEGKADADVTAALMVPLRQTAEQLGFSVTEKDGGILIDDGNLHTTVKIGEDSYVVLPGNTGMAVESAPFSLGVPPVVKDGVTFVPLSLFRVLLGNDPESVVIDGKIITLTRAEAVKPKETPVGMPNPFRDYVTVSGMQEGAGFPIELPNVKKAEALYRAIPGELAEVIYKRDGKEFLRIRKGKGEDVSGDYNRYPKTSQYDVKGKQVTMKGDGKKVRTATWKDGDFSYAVLSADGISVGRMKDLVKKVR